MGNPSETDLPLSSFQRELEREKLNALAEFAAGVGHEFNNPLAIISGHAQILLEKAESAEERRHLAVILAQVKRAYEMIADIRLFSRPPQPEWEAVPFREFIEEFYQAKLAEFPKMTQVLTISAPDESIFPVSQTFSTDPAMLRTILDALFKNAMEAADGQPDRKITLEYCLNGDNGESEAEKVGGAEFLEIALEDNGPGIDGELCEHIFSPYFSGRAFGRGLGFGLPKSWALAKALGGELTLAFSDTLARRTRFLLRFPLESIQNR